MTSLGAFFGVVSGKELIGKPVPDTAKTLDGTIVQDVQKKVGTSVFETVTKFLFSSPIRISISLII